ncbi:MAG: hypothetical protein CL566_09550 [Alphaproteobacteria bacterium]|nr:hypothetical protein [Alphaproteobacteria bacterium]
MAAFSFSRVIRELIQAPARHPLRGPFVLASSNHIKVVGDLPVYLIWVEVANPHPSGRFEILQSAQSCQCIVSNRKAA